MRMLLIALLVFIVNCDDRPVPQTGQSTIHEMEQTESNQQRLAVAVPPPRLTDSQERRNLVRRLELVNNPNRISYIHLLSYDGRVVFYTTVRGKVSSLNSLLTTPQQVVTVPHPCSGSSDHSSACWEQHVLPSPDFDGSYGENPHGIFWYTEENTYMEWNGTYFISDRPMRLTQEPVMTMAVDGRGTPITPTR